MPPQNIPRQTSENRGVPARDFEREEPRPLEHQSHCLQSLAVQLASHLQGGDLVNREVSRGVWVVTLNSLRLGREGLRAVGYNYCRGMRNGAVRDGM